MESENKDEKGASEETTPQLGADAARLATFSQYRGLLFSVAYRMLGSVADAEDMLQETFIRWQEAANDDVRSPRAFLVTVITRLCINQLQSARVRREEYVGEWLPEPPELRESLGIVVSSVFLGLVSTILFWRRDTSSPIARAE